MIIFDATEDLNGKIPEGCGSCPFATADAERDQFDEPLFTYSYFCSLTKDEICYGVHDISCGQKMKLTTCPLKEVEG